MLLRPAGKNSKFQAETKSPAILARELAAPGRYGAHLSQPSAGRQRQRRIRNTQCGTRMAPADPRRLRLSMRPAPLAKSRCRCRGAAAAKQKATRENAILRERWPHKISRIKEKNYEKRKKRSGRAQEPEAARNWASGSKRIACCAHGINRPTTSAKTNALEKVEKRSNSGSRYGPHWPGRPAMSKPLRPRAANQTPQGRARLGHRRARWERRATQWISRR